MTIVLKLNNVPFIYINAGNLCNLTPCVIRKEVGIHY